MKTNETERIFRGLKASMAPLAHRLAIASAVVATLGLAYGPSINQLDWAGSMEGPNSRKPTAARASWKNALAESKTGRVVLHTMCLLRHPERASWHWHGILREFAA